MAWIIFCIHGRVKRVQMDWHIQPTLIGVTRLNESSVSQLNDGQDYYSINLKNIQLIVFYLKTNEISIKHIDQTHELKYELFIKRIF